MQLCRPELLVMLATDNGQVLRWSTPLAADVLAISADAQLPPPQPVLQGLKVLQRGAILH